jgi:two-component system sensor histidine kinase DevS
MSFSPKILVNFVLILAALLAALLITIILYPPYTGFILEHDPLSRAMKVVKVEPWIEKQGLTIGREVVRLSNQSGLSVEIGPQHILKSAGQARLYFANRMERIREVDRMYNVLAKGEVTVTLKSGGEINLTLDRLRPLTSLSLSTWMGLIMSIGTPLIAALVWAWQPNKPETVLLLFSGIGFIGFSLNTAVSIYLIDMFYLPGILHWLMRTALDLGQLFFIVFGTAVLLYYPTRLSFADRMLKLLVIALIIYPLFGYLNKWEIIDFQAGQYPFFTDAETYTPMVLMYLGTILLCVMQYRVSRNRPVQYAQTLWTILAWTLGPGVFVVLYILPRWLGDGPILMGGEFVNATVLVVYLMILFGVARFNLFQLEQHIRQAINWVLVSVFFIALDLSLVSVVNISPAASNIIVLILVIWVYLPIRQLMYNRLESKQQSRHQTLVNSAVVLMIENSLESNHTPRKIWKDVLADVFKPVEISTAGKTLHSALAARGQELTVAGNTYSPTLRLNYAEGGTRLFNQKDIELVQMLNLLFEKVYDARDAFLAGRTQERDRIRRDLHDQIGHKLLSLIYAANDQKSRVLAQETLTQLSELIQALKHEPIHLEDLATRIRVICEDVCENASMKLIWDNEVVLDSQITVSSDRFLNVLNVIRELLSNTIKHAGASQIKISLACADNGLVVLYSDDGCGFDHNQVSPGNGLHNLQSRASELGAQISWDTSKGTSFKLIAPLPKVE